MICTPSLKVSIFTNNHHQSKKYVKDSDKMNLGHTFFLPRLKGVGEIHSRIKSKRRKKRVKG